MASFIIGHFSGLDISGNVEAVTSLFAGIQKPLFNFNIIEP